jgi:hypothetical protein
VYHSDILNVHSDCDATRCVPFYELENGDVFKSVVFIFCSSFKLFLELEPQLRDIIFKFYESKYASCLKLLDEIKVRFCGTPLFSAEFFLK